jgi:hypothetical protein
MKQVAAILTLAVLILATAVVHARAQPRPHSIPAAANVPGSTPFLAQELENGDFSQGQSGVWPLGWRQFGSAKPPLCAAETVSAHEKGVNYANCKSGAQCGRLQAMGRAFPAPCFLSQGVDAAAYRGKTFSFRANVRSEVPAPSIVYVLVRIHTEGARMGSPQRLDTSFFEHVPVTSDKWTNYEIKGVVDADAHDIELGVIIRGEGKAWIDNASLKFSTKPKYKPELALLP